MNEFTNKIMTMERLISTLANIRERYSIATTNGCFDILHMGHIYTFNEAKRYGDILIVLLNSDSSVRSLKPNRPINAQQERAILLSALEMVDYVTIFNEEDPRRALSLIKPDYHVKSASGYKGIEGETVKKNGGKVITIPDLPGYSTTNILSRVMREGYKIAKAEKEDYLM